MRAFGSGLCCTVLAAVLCACNAFDDPRAGDDRVPVPPIGPPFPGLAPSPVPMPRGGAGGSTMPPPPPVTDAGADDDAGLDPDRDGGADDDAGSACDPAASTCD